MSKENLVVIGGKNCGELARRVAEKLGGKYIQLFVRKFPDGEVYIRLPESIEGDISILFSCLGNRPNEGLVETVFALKSLEDYGAEKHILVIPYMPYARQDEVFSFGEVVSIKILDKIFRTFGVDALVTVDMHLHRFKTINEVFRFKAINTTVVPELARYVAEVYGNDVQIVAPDEEAEQWAKIASKEIGSDYIVLEKIRHGDEHVEISGLKEVKEKVLIIDDIISTGTTIAETAKLARQLGAKTIVVACAHALLVGDAEGKIFNSGVVELVASDTINNPYAKVSSTNAIVRGLKEVI